MPRVMVALKVGWNSGPVFAISGSKYTWLYQILFYEWWYLAVLWRNCKIKI